MSSTLAQLGARVLNRIEEDINAPKFWQLQPEIYPYLVEAQNEAMLISGEPQLRQNVATVPVMNSILQPMPAGAVCILRVESAGAITIKKTTLWDMDRFMPGWEGDINTTVGGQPDFWFPVGLTQWGIHPQLTQPANIILSYLAVPITSPRPYTGAEVCPFQTEYEEGFEDYASHVASLKEGGAEFQESIQRYDRFLKKMQELSKFATRKAVLRFSRVMGAPAGVTPVESA